MDDPRIVAEQTSVLVDVEGTVKWFDPRKGFGFVVGPGGQDIFVHFSVIEQPDGFRTLKDGERVKYCAAVGTKGWSASKVQSLGRPAKAATPSSA
ncbi:MAG: cold-shock protein [Phycisphaerae bacterium]|nr:cold-shock protein [Phycisphaerae bacterium]